MTFGLFKYFSTDQDKLERFVHRQVYLTPPMYFNDPWDYRLRFKPLTEQQLKREDPNYTQPGMTEHCQKISSSKWREDRAGELQDSISDGIGFVCLTERPLDRLMWAHYGDSHRGFVAEFGHHEEKAREAGYGECRTPFGPAAKLKYEQNLPELEWDQEEKPEVWLTKHRCWEYEQEWRAFSWLDEGIRHPARAGFYLRTFEPIDLVRVILGFRASSEIESRLRQMLSHPDFGHVRKEKVDIDPDSRELISQPLPLQSHHKQPTNQDDLNSAPRLRHDD